MPSLFSTPGVALITGAASGIGAQTARTFVKNDCRRLVLADINEEPLTALAAELKAAADGVDVLAVKCNVANEDDVKSLVSAAAAHFGRIDYAVNAAGIVGPNSHLASVETDAYDKLVSINARGLFLCQREELKQMAKQDPGTDAPRQSRGSIVNLASVAGLVGSGILGAYVSTKHAVVGLTKSAALENAPNGIRINAVAPGVIDTPMTREQFIQPLNDHLSDDKFNMGRRGRADEVADVIVFMSSDGASYVNGATWTIDGCWTAGR
ncbi:hypothetical protein VHUM_01061 [Vanrija humicola]|uniref:Uncharacterized protein n=1 Tax=Vanrija humicola TaxID=5417 RepID=A0A7D8Z6U7_VANHU|nr:hypothetical protein VHUM_01061 [Vanrija humicola]